MRPDKVTLAAVAATLGLYRAGLAEERIPVWRMIAMPAAEVRARAEVVARAVGAPAEVVDVRSTVGGGSLPGETLPSAAVSLGRVPGRSVAAILARLREGEPAVIGRIEDERVLLDLRTIAPEADAGLTDAIRAALRG
jgi:L-seryl-tRNA(Ser) seleniumtransferase